MELGPKRHLRDLATAGASEWNVGVPGSGVLTVNISNVLGNSASGGAAGSPTAHSDGQPQRNHRDRQHRPARGGIANQGR